MRYKYTSFLLFCLLSISCLKEPVTFEWIEKDKTKLQQETLPFSGIIVFIKDNDIYMTDSLRFKNPKRLTFNGNELKKNVTINYSRDKIAYIDYTSTQPYPIIIDTNGVEQMRLPTYTLIKEMSWSNDGNTLVMRKGTNLLFYGSAFSISIPNINSSSGFYYGFAMSRNKDIAYVYYLYAGSFEGNKVDFFSTSRIDRSNTINSVDNTKMQFSNDANNLLVANLGYDLDGIEKAYVYNLIDFTYTTAFSGNTTSRIKDISLSADSKYAIYSSQFLNNEVYNLYYKNLTDGTEKVFYTSASPISSIDCR